MFVDFTITGMHAMLMHADDYVAADDLAVWRKDPVNRKISAAGDDRSPPWTWVSYVYHDDNEVIMPWENLMAALRKAAGQIKGSGRSTLKTTSMAGLMPVGEHFEFFTKDASGTKWVKVPWPAIDAMRDSGMTFAEQAEAVKDLGFALFVKRAAIQRAKHIRVRPRFNEWQVRGTLHVDDNIPELTLERVQQMFDIAGQLGLGDWRPSSVQSPGIYGRFQAEVSKRKTAKRA